jgi:hypothetical protein
MTPTIAALEQDLLDVIARGAHAPLAEAAFAALALRVFAYQYAANHAYRAYCERRGAHPGTVSGWRDIPAVPTDAFKSAPLVCGAPSAAATVFRTSGTTGGTERRGEHRFPSLRLYDAALARGFEAHLLPDGARPRILSLVPDPSEAPDSSLSHMVGVVMAAFAPAGSDVYVRDGSLRVGAVLQALEEAERAGEPVCLLGTSFAFVHLLDALDAAGFRVRLPVGSRLMDTGGFKGRSREVSREGLYAALSSALGVPVESCVNEYGMTEMSSQFYDAVAGRESDRRLEARVHRGPGWVRTEAYDPETLEPLPPGEPGVLRHWDLANLHSVAVLQTADLGVMSGEGFRLQGRASGAESRGCSIALDELLEAQRSTGRTAP